MMQGEASLPQRIISRRDCLQSVAGVLAGPRGWAAAPSRPNIVIIVSDDHGYADLSCYDHPKEVRTPNIDRIARSGVRFAQGYANAYVCAPTRAALLTGRYSQRYGFYTASDSRAGLPLDQVTLAAVLKREGYATGAFGKWHLGLEMPYHPCRRGFDEFYGFLGHGAHDYFNLQRDPDALFNAIWRNEQAIDDTGYLTDNLRREAVSFVAGHEKRPFFLYLAFNAVHYPLQAPPEVVRKYDTGNPKRDIYLAMLEREDAAVGALLDELEKRRLQQNTLVVFFSDNGGARANASSNGALRDFKQSVYEGGIRVPFMMSWPGRIRPDTVSREPVMSMDVLPTVCAAAGASLPKDVVFDGKDILAALTGQTSEPLHDAMFWDGAEEKTAVRSGRWKLVNNRGRTELFDLDADLSEKNDLAPHRPDIISRLQAAFDEWSKQNRPRLTRGAANEAEAGGARSAQRDTRRQEKKRKKQK
jgi:arylsulfatase A-like enzyme